MDVILRSLESVRTRLFAYAVGLGVKGVAERALSDEGDRMSVPTVASGIPAPGRRLWVMNVREVSTVASFVRISVHIFSIISSSLRKLTSRFVGWTLTSTR